MQNSEAGRLEFFGQSSLEFCFLHLKRSAWLLLACVRSFLRSSLGQVVNCCLILDDLLAWLHVWQRADPSARSFQLVDQSDARERGPGQLMRSHVLLFLHVGIT